MKPSEEQQHSSPRYLRKSLVTVVPTEANNARPYTAPDLLTASTPAMQAHSAVLEPTSTTAAFYSMFDSGLAALRRRNPIWPPSAGKHKRPPMTAEPLSVSTTADDKHERD
ncbi:hypothetical protein [Rhizobium etli]|uniref:hypothetical protein n=1 Tax=Rhizobium etli TaxID=29449 RepID=UPI0003839E4C|nr:hypothetical protein [Rhizobium etli]AGS24552.1 hypothetical protein REMIM1_PC00199 [Rhizobium etli bv. mimosae str. Mim1]